MSLLGHDDVIFFPGKMMSGFIFYVPVFSIVSKHIKWSFLTKQIIYEFPLEIFEPWDDWENEFEKLPQVSALCFSVF